MTLRRMAPAALCLVFAACGGGSSPTSPAAAAPMPAAQACDIVNAPSSFASTISILSGAACATSGSPVVRLNMRGPDLQQVLGSCTGTVIAPRAILTAAHCLDEGVGQVRVWLGSGDEILTTSFVFYPNYVFNDPNTFDVGVVFVNEDLPRTAVSLLWSRAGQVGETAIIAGWGRDENQATTQLRAGSTVLSAVTSTSIQTAYAPPSSSVCSGDSGGPILLHEGSAWAIAGITSATSQNVCNTGTNFYQPVRHDAVRNFIQQHVPGVRQK